MKIKSFLLLFTFLICLNSCKVARFFVYNFANITDYKKFPARTIEKGNSTFQFKQADQEKFPKEFTIEGKQRPFEEYIEENKTVAFLVIQRDTILYERYFGKYQEESIVASFSMAKSVLSILIGCALDDQLIQSVNEPITNYIPELKENGFEKVTIEHLLQMTSGLDFNESYVNPFGDAATFYYGRNLRKAIQKMELEYEPGKRYNYVSGDSQLLGLVLERALKDKSVSAYLEEKIWKPLQMEYDASWSIDKKKDGLEKTFCCLNARARDFAKIGRLYLNQGSWNGKQIVSKDWVEQSTKTDVSNGSAKYYQYQWWKPTSRGDFMAQGILGQYIYVYPEKDLIIVRLGKSKGKANWWNLLANLGSAY